VPAQIWSPFEPSEEAPRYFADQARARVAEIETKVSRQERQTLEAEARRVEQQRTAQERAVLERRFRDEGRIKVDAKVIHGAPTGKDLEVGPEMVVVPAGEPTVGSNDQDSGKPPHKAIIKAPFAVGRFAVTFEEWDCAAAAGGVSHKPGDQGWGRGRRPTINVSWEDAKVYAAWLSKATGKTYRLLSEDEWEYCCRAGTTTMNAFGDDILKTQAQFSEVSWGSARQTVEVGKFAPNGWGLYDMHGNVWEWREENWHSDYKGAPATTSARQDGGTSFRVVRGGSWFDIPVNLRSARRYGIRPEPGFYVGFRLARTLLA
jgi:formylglycine-generating enzyme required for sulfatase activity